MGQVSTPATVVELVNASKTFGKTQALSGVNLTIRKGECLVLAGPSGAGKTTLLRVVAGLETLDAGDIRIEGKSVKNEGPYNRRTGMTFESYALYPHLSVRENIAFPLKSKRNRTAHGGRATSPHAREGIEAKVRRMAGMLRIDQLLDRRTDQLSGGQRQRVALARCLVRDAAVYLLDEPLAHLDAKLRLEMRTEFKRMVASLDATLIYVTHNYREAMALADRIAIIQNGTIVQVGPPEQVFDEPASRFAAKFVGDPPMNLVEGIVENGTVRVGSNGSSVVLGQFAAVGTSAFRGGPVWVGMRPMDCYSDGSPGNGLTGLVRAVKTQQDGSGTVLVETPTDLFEVALADRVRPAFGDVINIRVDTARALVFDRARESLVGRVAARAGQEVR
jgi:multiple sugar transport system ATP-binding protein